MRPTSRRARPRRAALLAPLAAVALLLGACSGGDGEGDEPSTEPTSAAPEEEAEPTEEPDAGASGGAACVEGTWESDAEAQAAATTSALGMSELGATATVTGESVTTFQGTTMTTEYADQVVTVEWGMEGQAIRLVNTWSGTLTGTVEVTDEEIVISDVDTSGLQVTYETSVNGEAVEIPGMEEIPMSGMAAGGTSTYTCSGDELQMTPVVEGVDTAGFVTVLRRR